MKVLIADDDAVSRRMLGNRLEHWQYEVVSACDGAEAWRLLQEPDAPQLVILDWMMPGMTGPEVCRQVRQHGRDTYTYILLLTARTEKQDLVEGMEAGADDYVTKPFDAQELKVRLRAGRRILDLQSDLLAAREALREQATRDPLTCLWNRYALLDILNREINRSCRELTPLGLIMVDVDHFKTINDTYGHLTGDAVLRELTRRMQGSLRRYDAVGRYGGEEFLIVLPGSGRQTSMQLADRLRDAVSSEPIVLPEASLHTTISLGVTCWQGQEQPAPELLIRLADEALYRAKSMGRNRTEWSEAEQELAR